MRKKIENTGKKKAFFNGRLVKRAVRILMSAGIVIAAIAPSVKAQELDNAMPANQEGDTAVDGTVSGQSPGSPAYVLRIPSAIDFGILQAPAVDTDSFKDISFQVELVSLSNLQRGSVVSVMARDGKAPAQVNDPNVPFAIEKSGDKKLLYSVYTGSTDPDQGSNLEDTATWYENGYLFGSFNHAAVTGSSIPGVLRLNQRQLYGQDISAVTGDYSGQIHFYSRIANAADFN